MPGKLSKVMEQCLDAVKAHGGVIAYRKGGWWTAPETPLVATGKDPKYGYMNECRVPEGS